MNKLKSMDMKKLIKPVVKDRMRAKGRVSKRDRNSIQLVIDLPNYPVKFYNLDDRDRYKVYRYTTEPMCLVVATSEVIQVHSVCRVDGEILKVARVEELDQGVVELKCVRFARYNPLP